jgi:hypothetical protein
MLRHSIVVSASAIALICASLASADEHSAAPFRPSPTVDVRGFIDVWKLREDVASIEPLEASDDTESCHPEGDPDEHLTQKQIKYQERKAAACEKRVAAAYAAYEEVRKALNSAWLPLIYEAIRRDDRVAEVIMRQCETTQILDRTGIESTCDSDRARLAIARERLKKIGFVPAFDVRDQLLPTQRVPRPNPVEVSQSIVLERFRAGALGFNSLYVNPGGNLAHGPGELEKFRTWALIETISQDAQAAFTFSSGDPNPVDWATDSFRFLQLSRKPLTPGYLTWGPALHYGGGYSIYTGPHYWRSTPLRAFLAAGSQHIVFSSSADFQSDRTEMLASIASSIHRYLTEDPRWAVFLLHRIGHHEWVPERTQSATSLLDGTWMGSWMLEMQTQDWTMPMKGATGHAVIKRDGDSFKITIVADQDLPPLQNVDNCELRYSGGSTFLPALGPKGQKAGATVFGDFNLLSADTHPAGSFVAEGANSEAVAPLDPKRQYKQVLMLCDKAESRDSDRVRFLILAGDTLLEVGTESPFSGALPIRHYHRVQ